MDYNEYLANLWITDFAPLTAQEAWYYLTSLGGQATVALGFVEEILLFFFQDSIY